MTASVSSPEDVVNVALRRIGVKDRVENLYDGSDAARAALDIYAQTRDELLRKGDWDFADRDALLVLQKQAPNGGYIPGITAWTSQYPTLPWRFQYAYPADCLKLRSVRPPPLFLPDMDPQPHRFSEDNDATIPGRVVLSNVPNAVATYTAQVTDPTAWDSDFVEALSAALARRLAPSLASVEQERMELPDEANTEIVAENRQG